MEISVNSAGAAYSPEIKGEFQAKTHAPSIDPFCHINLVDIIFAKVVCISILGGLPELSSQEDKAGGQLTPIINWRRGSSGGPPGMYIQTPLAKIMSTR